MIRTQADLEALVSGAEPSRIVVDTEYASEGRYRGVLGLVQLAWDDQWAIVDPLETSLEPLGAWRDAQWVTHDGSQDWGLLLEAGMVRPAELFDTQFAARMLGLKELGLAKLMVSQLGEAHDKGAQRSNWLKRPLSQQQLIYAREDVVGLQRLATHLEDQLRQAGRWSATLQAGEEALDRWCEVGPRRPPSLRRFRRLRRQGADVHGRAHALLVWREAEGYRKNRPARWLLTDDDLVDYALGKKEPTQQGQIQALAQAKPLTLSRHERFDSAQNAALKRLKRQRQAIADRIQMDPTLLAPPALLNALVVDEIRPETLGWRAGWIEAMLNEPTDPDPAPRKEPVGSVVASAVEASSSTDEDAISQSPSTRQ